MQYNFEWDLKKARSNKTKHDISFELAATVFKDPRALSLFDAVHSEIEDRWFTLGLASNGVLLVVHHTFKVAGDAATIRIISSRKATEREMIQYRE